MFAAFFLVMSRKSEHSLKGSSYSGAQERKEVVSRSGRHEHGRSSKASQNSSRRSVIQVRVIETLSERQTSLDCDRGGEIGQNAQSEERRGRGKEWTP